MPMKDGFNLKTLFPIYNDPYLQQYDFIGDIIILLVFSIFFCIIGLVGNGYIVWLLGFRIKRNPFAIYMLNLAVADFGTLLILLPLDICLLPSPVDEYLLCPYVFVMLLISLFVSMYTCSQILVTAISIDRWVSVLFPIWYQPHHSPVLSTTVCAFIWTLCFALIGVPSFLYEMDYLTEFYGNVFFGVYIVTWFTCLLLMIISTLMLVIKICLKSQQGQCRNLSKVVLFMLLSFILFNTLTTVSGFPISLSPYMFLWISLKGSINPVIYFLAGRQKGGKFQERMRVILQRVFREERDTGMELQPRTQMVL